VETRVRTPLGLRSSEVISGLRVSEWPRIGPAARARPSRLVALSRLEHAVSFPSTVYPVERVLLTEVGVHPAWPPPSAVTPTLHVYGGWAYEAWSMPERPRLWLCGGAS